MESKQQQVDCQTPTQMACVSHALSEELQTCIAWDWLQASNLSAVWVSACMHCPPSEAPAVGLALTLPELYAPLHCSPLQLRS